MILILAGIPFLALCANAGLFYLLVRSGITPGPRRIFAVFLAAISLVCFSSFTLHTNLLHAPVVSLSGVILFGAVMYAALLHFATVFPRRMSKGSWLALFFYILIPTAVIPAILAVKEVQYLGGGVAYIDLGPLAPVFFAYMLGAGALAAALLLRSFRTAAEHQERRRVLYPMVAAVVLTGGGLLNAAPALRGYPVDIVAGVVTAALISYAVLKHHLLDIAVVLRESVVYALPVLGATLLYLAVMLPLLVALEVIGIAACVVAGVAIGVLIALAYYNYGDVVQAFLRRAIFRTAYDFRRKVEELSRLLSRLADPQELSNSLLDMIADTLKYTWSAVWLFNKRDHTYAVSAHRGLEAADAREVSLDADHPFVARLTSCSKILGHAEMRDFDNLMKSLQVDHEPVSTLDPSLALPLKGDDMLIGFIMLGPKASGSYSQDDVALLGTLGHQAGVGFRNAMLYREMTEMATRDGLTGAYNQRYMVQRLPEEMERASRLGLPLSLLLVDIDMFHVFNEMHGHGAGDTALVELVRLMRRRARRTDLIFRYGGEEFAVVALGTAASQAHGFGERLQRDVENHHFRGAHGVRTSLTVSIGVATSPDHADSWEQLLFCADMALLEAKEQGRNTTCLYSPAEEERILEPSTTRSAYLSTIYALAATIDARDTYTYGHSQEVARYATALGKALGFSSERLSSLRMAALLHDIGKIGVPDHILQKAGVFTLEERLEMQKHPLVAETILHHVSALSPLLTAVLHHHERFDGKGYPSGLRGDDIPLEARILAIADACDAMSSFRSHRGALTKDAVIAELIKGAGTQFDPSLTVIFCELLQMPGGLWDEGRPERPSDAEE